MKILVLKNTNSSKRISVAQRKHLLVYCHQQELHLQVWQTAQNNSSLQRHSIQAVAAATLRSAPRVYTEPIHTSILRGEPKKAPQFTKPAINSIRRWKSSKEVGKFFKGQTEVEVDIYALGRSWPTARERCARLFLFPSLPALRAPSHLSRGPPAGIESRAPLNSYSRAEGKSLGEKFYMLRGLRCARSRLASVAVVRL